MKMWTSSPTSCHMEGLAGMTLAQGWGEDWREEPGLERWDLRLGLWGLPSLGPPGPGERFGEAVGPATNPQPGSSSPAWMVAHQELGHSSFRLA